MKLRLGHVHDIALYIDASWIIIFLVVTYSLGAGYFGFLYPNWPPQLVWGLSLVTSALFFASVVAHEMAHSLVAQRHGITVESITLFLFGGVARMRSEPDDPKVELIVSLAGPAASLVLGLGFGVLHYTFGGLDSGNPVGVTATYLMLINLVVAVFNMVPGLPLDGGRVFRALLWWHSGNALRATRLSARFGQGFGALLVIVGVGMGVQGGLFNGVWFALVGWFLWDAARNAIVQARSQSALAGVSLAALIEASADAVPADASLQELFDTRLGDNAPGPLPVITDGQIAGLVGVPEVKRVDRARWAATPVRAAMVPVAAYPAVAADSDAWDTLMRMNEQDLESLVVLQDGEFRGVVSQRGLLRFARASQAT